MNVICIMSDTFRRDHIAAYADPAPWPRTGHEGEPFIATPALDQFASESAMFDRHYVSSYPTVPARYDLFTGRFGFPQRGWQPLEVDDVILSELLADHGMTSMMIFDTPMLATDSYNYMRGFAGWEFVRGQHADRYIVDPIDVTLPAAPYKMKNVAATERYLRNTAHRRGEADWMCGKTVTRAIDWLERNRHRDDFLLYIDLWDPHEPFDAPDFDVARYADPAYDGGVNIYPQYGRAEYLTDDERNHIRALYAGLVTLTDRWIGRLLEKIETLGLDRNSMIIFLSDHGHLFGDHGLQGKPTGPLGRLYEVTTRIPLMIRHPEGAGAGQRFEGISQAPDLLPTILATLDIPIPESIHGRSLLPMMLETSLEGRECAVSGRHSRIVDTKGRLARRLEGAAFDGASGLATPGEPLTLTTERWAFICPVAGRGRPELYDLATDPGQQHDVFFEQSEIAGELHAMLTGFLEKVGMAPNRLAAYRFGDQADDHTPLLPPDTPLWGFEDDRGLAFSFASEAEAAERSGGGPLHSTTLGDLWDAHPKALVGVHDQYYWAEDLA